MKNQSKTKKELIEELDSLQQRVAEYERLDANYRTAEKRLQAVNECLLSLGNNMEENIRQLTALTGALIGATAAIYNRLQGDMLIAVGHWQTPPGFSIKDLAQGHICYDVIRKNEERIICVRNLADSPYAKSDPNVCAYGLATYIGHVVRWGSEPVGSLCVVFQQDFIPTADDERLLGIMAASIGAQEKRWRTENALQESEATLSALINAPTDSILLLDTRGVILDLNNVAAERLGKPKDKLIGTLADKSLPADIARKRRSLISQVMETGKLVRFEDKRDSVWFDTVAYPIKDRADKINKIAVIARDISDRKQTEELLQEERALFLDMVNTQPVGIYRIRVFARKKWRKKAWQVPQAAPYVVELASDRFCEILGVTRSVYESTPGLVEDMVHPEDKAEFASKNIEANTKLIPFKWKGRLCVGKKIIWAQFESLPRLLKNGDILWTGFLHDITDRKQAEKALKKSAEKLHKEMRFNILLLDNSPAFIVAIGFDGKTLMMNRSLLNSLEYTAEEIKDTDYLTTFVPEEDRAELAPVFEIIEKGSTATHENRIVSKSGKTYLVEWHGVAVNTNEQEGGFFIGIGNDITKRKKAENALRKSEEKYRTLIDTTDTGFVIIDNDGRVQDANAEYVRLTGHRKIGDIIGRKVIEWTADSDKGKNAAAVRECFSKGYIRNLEINYVDAKGKLTPIEINATCLENEGKIQTITLCRDITKRRRAEEYLSKSEKKYKLVTEKMTDVVWLMDMNLRTTYVSPSVMTALGFTQEERLNQTVNEQLTPDSLSKVGNLLAEQLALEAEGGADPQRSLSCVLEYYRKDGSTRWFENNISGIRDEQGVLIGLHGVSRDITDRKKAEEALRESEEKYRILLSESPDPTFSFTPKGQYKYVNRAFAEGVGKPVEEIIGKSLWDIFSREEADKRFVSLSQVFRTGEEKVIEVRVPRADGDRYYITTITPIKDTKGEMLSVICTSKDITERKRAEEALKKSEESFRALFEKHSAINFVVDPENGDIIEANEAAAKYYGWSRVQLTKMKIQDINTLSPAEVKIELENARNSNKSYFEFRHRRADGSIRDVEVFSGCVEIGGKIFLHSIIHDTTDRKRVEEALRESEERFKSIVSTSQEWIWSLDTEGRHTYSNPAVERILALRPDEIIGHDLFNILHEEDLPLVKKILAQGLKNKCGWASVVLRWRHKDGEYRYLESSAVPVLDSAGTMNGFYGSDRDITERILAAKNIQESQERLSGFMNAATDSFYLLDANLHFLEINEKGLKIIGKKKEEIIGRDIREVVPDIVESGRYAKHLEVIRTGEPFAIENHITHPIFGNLYVILKSFKVGEGIGVIASDITELKRAQEEKRYLEERLQRAEKMEALGTLAGGVAHDLNNVLGVIVGYAELLLSEISESNAIRTRLEKIMTGSEKASAIVQDLLTLARRGVPSRKVLNLNKIIIDYQKSPELEKLASFNPYIEIKMDLEADLLNISGSPVHLGKTLFNLLINAFEAMPHGGILTIKTANQYLDNNIQGYDEVREGEYVVLTVSDTGEGISATDMQHIFEPFYTKKIMGKSGTGLGLAVVWGTVKDHNGYINVQSEEGKGSAFFLYFPVARKEISADAAAIAMSEYTGKRESLLVVDDIREQRELASEMLCKLNYEVAIAASGEEAIAYLREHRVDLLVLDMIMDPGMDGLDTYRKAREINPVQKAIIVSGFSETERVNTALQIGVGAYVKKPYVIEKLGIAVRKELDRN